jgi:hypothetical protein
VSLIEYSVALAARSHKRISCSLSTLRHSCCLMLSTCMKRKEVLVRKIESRQTRVDQVMRMIDKRWTLGAEDGLTGIVVQGAAASPPQIVLETKIIT